VGGRRNQNYTETHQLLIETAVRLISECGVEALSLVELARVMKMNRSTVYYHFKNREALIAAVKKWSSDELTKGRDVDLPRSQRIDHINRFVLENPDVIKLFIDDFISVGDIRQRYPQWEDLVRGMSSVLRRNFPGQETDPEVYCVLMLTAAFIAPRVFKNSVRPDASIDTIVARFGKEQERMLRLDALIPDEDSGTKRNSDRRVARTRGRK
jgi:AcrR family transcriptional regulator